MLFQTEPKLYQETVIPLVPILVLSGIALIILITVIVIVVKHIRKKNGR